MQMQTEKNDGTKVESRVENDFRCSLTQQTVFSSSNIQSASDKTICILIRTKWKEKSLKMCVFLHNRCLVRHFDERINAHAD